jgi:hypothetical protein
MHARILVSIAVSLTLQCLTLTAFAGSWRTLSDKDGLRLETRDVSGLPFWEIRLVARSDSSVQTLCDVVWDSGEPGEQPPEIKLRQVVEYKTSNERVTYEQVKVPVVSDRDYVVHSTRKNDPQKCEVAFENVTDKGPAPRKDHVRVPKIFGSWTITPSANGSLAIFTIYSDPGGGVPALFAQGPQRDSAVAQMRNMLAKAKKVEARASLR